MIDIYVLPIRYNTEENLLKLASRYSDKKLLIARKKNNKPYFRNEKTVYFNKSHSGNKVVFAFSKNNIGVDLEKIKVRKRQHQIAKRICSKKEFSKYQKSKN